MQRRMHGAIAGTAAAAALALILTGCTSGGDDTGGGEAAGTTYMDMATGECAAPPLEGVDFEGANEFISSFEEPVTSLLTDTPLPEPVTPGTTVAYLNNDSAIGAIYAGFLEEATTAAGAEFINVSVGTDAQSINSALNSVVELAPDILLAVSIDAQFWTDQLAALQANGTSVVYAGQTNAADFGLNETLGGTEASYIIAKVLGAAGIAYTCGTATEFVYYRIPEIQPTLLMGEAVIDYYTEACPECTVRVVDISITDPSPADKIVSDLQAHPETQFFIASADQFQVGLKDKASLAGLTNAIGIGGASLPTNFQQVADGQQVAAYAIDFEIFVWQLLDEGFRKQQDAFEEYDANELVGQISQVLTIRNVEDSIDGYVAFPGMKDEFLALWGK